MLMLVRDGGMDETTSKRYQWKHGDNANHAWIWNNVNNNRNKLAFAQPRKVSNCCCCCV